MDLGIWQELYRHIQNPPLQDTVVGFNTNLDRIIPVTRELLDPSFLHDPDYPILSARLIQSMQHGTAEEWFISELSHYNRFTRMFSSAGSLAIGGQAGIAALHISGLGVRKVVCASPLHGPESAGILNKAGVIVPEFTTGNNPAADYIHLVFEYAPGLVSLVSGVIPRNNRFIISPVHEPASVLIPKPFMEPFLAEIASCNRAFLSGYQYLRSEQDFATAADQMYQMKNRNPSLRIHIESVSVTDNEVLNGLVRHILPAADSFGLNEHELFILLAHLNPSDPVNLGEKTFTPAENIQGALTLCRHVGLTRLHVHTFGYYILVLHKNIADVTPSRNALLYASREVACAAQGTGREISAEGIRALGVAEEIFGKAASPGIFPADDYVILVIPTLVAANIKRTSGLGDILSSTAFVADKF
jgi:ADP-dependent phosphofructokinase/glucokinase